jgi:uncharacterized protein (DUF1330 family)
MDIDKLKRKLETNIILIKFDSLKSQRTYFRDIEIDTINEWKVVQ